MKKEFVFKNPNRKLPQHEDYVPEYVRLGKEPIAEPVSKEEVQQAILMNASTLGALSKPMKPVLPINQSPNQVNRQTIQKPNEMLVVSKQTFSSTKDIEANDVFIPPQYQSVKPFQPKLSVVPPQPTNELEEVDSPEELKGVPEGHFCLSVGDALISVESKGKALELIQYILDGDDEQFKGIEMKDIALFQRLPVAFGFHCP